MVKSGNKGKGKAGKAVSSTVQGLAGVAAPPAGSNAAAMAVGSIDPGFTAVQPTAGACSIKMDARLVLVDPSQNMDKFYIVQVIEDAKGAYWCHQRWGRTGTSGQSKLSTGSVGAMVAEFKKKFKEKSGVDYPAAIQGASPLVGKYRWLATAVAVRGQAVEAKWEYYIDDFVDGKATDWYDYEADASDVVEQLYVDKHVSKTSAGLAVRFVTSGTWTYEVDLRDAKGNFTQRNTHTNKTRKIRRTPVAGAAIMSPAKAPKAKAKAKAQPKAQKAKKKVKTETKVAKVVKAAKAAPKHKVVVVSSKASTSTRRPHRKCAAESYRQRKSKRVAAGKVF